MPHRIPVDLPQVEVRPHGVDVGGRDAVAGAVDPVGGRRRGRFAGQGVEDGALDQRDDAAGGRGRAAVVFASRGVFCQLVPVGLLLTGGRLAEGGVGFFFWGGGKRGAYLACQNRRT